MDDTTSDNDTVKQPKKKRSTRLPLSRLIIILVLVASLGLSGYFYVQLRDARNNPEKVQQAKVEDLVGSVAKLITLPTDEQPTVATVQDKEKLAEQPFFKDAQNGDKLLIYTTAQKAIIYRESTNSLINVGPVTLDTPTEAVQPDPQPAAAQ